MVDKLEKITFLFLLFCLPFQRRVFLLSAGPVNGFNEWQSVFLYGTDILVFTLFGFWFWNYIMGRALVLPKARSGPLGQVLRLLHKTSVRPLARKNAKRLLNFLHVTCYGLLVIFLLFSSLSIFWAPYKVIGIYRFIKLFEFVGLFFITRSLIRRIAFPEIALAFVAGGMFQALIAISQFIFQHSIGLGFLGESPLAVGREGVAQFIAFGGRFMRAYGTFPSPNVLAAYLSIALLFLMTWYLYLPTLKRGHTIFMGFAGTLLASALFLTFSRTVLFAFAVAFFIFFGIIFFHSHMQKYRKRAGILLVPLLLLGCLIMTLFWPEIYSRILTLFNYNDFAFRERLFFSKLGFQVIQANPFGIGIGNYALVLRDAFPGLRDWLYQPLHNLFLLIAAEIGVIGALCFLGFFSILFWQVVRSIHKTTSLQVVFFLASFIFIFLSSLFDHFYWTLQQGSLLFWIIVGLGFYSIILKSDKV